MLAAPDRDRARAKVIPTEGPESRTSIRETTALIVLKPPCQPSNLLVLSGCPRSRKSCRTV